MNSTKVWESEVNPAFFILNPLKDNKLLAFQYYPTIRLTDILAKDIGDAYSFTDEHGTPRINDLKFLIDLYSEHV